MKKEFKGTQGNWKHSEIMNFSDTLVSYINSDEKAVAQLRGCGNGEEKEAEANAKLIASAPEMLEILSELENDNESIPNWIWERIQKVLDKNLT